jgi:hypothetical protein
MLIAKAEATVKAGGAIHQGILKGEVSLYL